jgi:hypothetical protein
MELTLLIARLAQRLDVAPPATGEPGPTGMVVNRPQGGVPFQVTRRYLLPHSYMFGPLGTARIAWSSQSESVDCRERGCLCPHRNFDRGWVEDPARLHRDGVGGDPELGQPLEQGSERIGVSSSSSVTCALETRSQ